MLQRLEILDRGVAPYASDGVGWNESDVSAGLAVHVFVPPVAQTQCGLQKCP